MKKMVLSDGIAHTMPDDLEEALISNDEVLRLWHNITSLAQNEFICWVENAKRNETRKRRVKRTCEELLEGKKRPCCWVGCVHRTDKSPSKWAQKVILDKS